MSDNGTEYEFTLPDGSKRYEIVMERSDIHAFARMHKATAFRPVAPTTEGRRDA